MYRQVDLRIFNFAGNLKISLGVNRFCVVQTSLWHFYFHNVNIRVYLLYCFDLVRTIFIHKTIAQMYRDCFEGFRKCFDFEIPFPYCSRSIVITREHPWQCNNNLTHDLLWPMSTWMYGIVIVTVYMWGARMSVYASSFPPDACSTKVCGCSLFLPFEVGVFK